MITKDDRRFWIFLKPHERMAMLENLVEQGLLERDGTDYLRITPLGEKYISDGSTISPEMNEMEFNVADRGGSLKIRVLESADQDVLDGLEAMCRETQRNLTGKGVVFGWAICDAHDHVLREE